MLIKWLGESQTLAQIDIEELRKAIYIRTK